MGLIPFLSPISIVSQKHVKRKMAQAILNSQARRCQCNAHQRRHDETIDLISRQNEFNEIVTEETDNLRQRFESKGRAVCIIDVELNETREEITRLEDEIRRDEPEVLQMSLAELRSVNDHLAEDLRILADKFPPASKTFESKSRPQLYRSPQYQNFQRQVSGGSETSVLTMPKLNRQKWTRQCLEPVLAHAHQRLQHQK